MCAGLWHGEARGLPAHFIHPCWQPSLLFTLCSAHMASKHITKAEITFWNLKLQQLPQNTKTHPWCMQTPALQHHGQLSSSLTRFCAMGLLSSMGQSYPSHYPLLPMLLRGEAFFFLWPSLTISCVSLSFLHLLCYNFSWMQHRGAHACETKTIPYHLHNLIWPLTWSSRCYIICCLHSPGSPVFSLSVFYRMKFCCIAPNKCTEDVINTGYFAFDPERINVMWNIMKRFITYFIFACFYS